MAMPAGEGVGLVRSIKPAADVLEAMVREAVPSAWPCTVRVAQVAIQAHDRWVLAGLHLSPIAEP